MNQTTDPRAKLQQLLRDLFQFDCADLDFGIYRIMNHKRAEIERFIERDLLDAVNRELEQGALAEQASAASELAEVRQQIAANLGAEAVSPEGELADQYHRTPLGQRYLELREQAASYHARPEQETLVFNHLYAFFSRYYQDGDFISKRRYSRRERYAIPYNGEEVYLHWANRDQYYVKTGEYFTDYTFKTPGGVTVHFKLQAADVEQNNVKGEKRFFVPLTAKATWDGTAREVVIPFEYRPLTEQEGITYGTRDQQEKIIAEALEKLPARLKKHAEAVAALVAERRRNKDGEPVSYLEHHLRQYTRRNTSDFFIHKDLRAFLERELDFYLKNEVLNLDEILAGDEARAEGWFQLMQVIRRIALCIIAFLAQIEDFQRRLWEKKKFVLSTEYCMTLDRVPEEFYPEIAANQAQIEEWRRLFRIDEIAPTLFHSGGSASLTTGGKTRKAKGKGRRAGLDVAFLKAHPTLVLDTRFFDQDFKDRLLAAFDDLDEETSGLLIHGENFQALSLLLEAYRDRVKCIYIDPPYNTGHDEFVYRDAYQHSCWVAMMEARLALAREMLRRDGCIFVNSDDNEQARLKLLLDGVFAAENFLADIVWEKVHTRKNSARYFSVSHDHIPVYAREKLQWDRVLLPREDTSAYTNPDNDPKGPWKPDPVYANNPYDVHYTITKPNGTKLKPPPGQYWRFSEDTFKARAAAGEVIWGNGNAYPMIKRYLAEVQEGLVPVTLLTRDFAGDNSAANEELNELFGEGRVMTYPKPTLLVRRLAQVSTRPQRSEFVLDFFAGSGTTGDAVLRQNAEDGGDRRYVLVELGRFFDTVLRPRIEKVMFSREWKDGKPTSSEGHSHIFKYQRLESYEDALDNIAFDDASGQRALDLYGGDYLLRYMLDFETRESETLLNVEKLESPFSYSLRIHRDGDLPAEASAQAGTREQPVDLPETFNYLIGLRVKTRRVYKDGDRRYLIYRGSNERSEVVVIWRDTKGWTQADLERDRQFVLEQKLTEGADEVCINGDSFIPGAQALDPVFKRLMLGGAE
jgi:adenine-specific DNA-methyltransferase